jgi:hypothetical protein
MSNYKKNVLMKKFTNKIFAALIAPMLAVGCIEEAFPEGATQVADQVGASEFALGGLVNSFPVAMMQVDTRDFYSKYGTHVDFGIPAIHLMTESMLEDIAVMSSNPGYWSFNYWSRNVGMNDQSWPCGYFWENYYAYIKIANDVISVIEVSDDMPELNKHYLGYGYAYRAMCYLDLARMYEPKENDYTDVSKVLGLTVPIITDKTTSEQIGNNPRVPREEMYEFILSDLKMAADLLATADNNYTTPTLAAVYAMYAKAYLEMGYWKEGGDVEAFKKAAEYARLAIETSGKTPLTEAQWHDPVNGFNKGSANNSWIWGLPVSNDLIGNIICYTAHICCEGQWGYTTVSNPGIDKSLYEKINDKDFRKNSFLSPNPVEWTSGKYKFAGTTVDQQVFLGALARPYTAIKFRPVNGNCTEYVEGNPADHCLLRVEELYFIEMEAVAHYDLAKAKNLLNTFMTYRITDGSYDCSEVAKDVDWFISEMFIQKRIEFWAEGVMFYDYKRLDKGITRFYEGSNHPNMWAFNTTGRSPQWNLVINRGEFQANVGINESTNNPDPSGLLVVPAE